MGFVTANMQKILQEEVRCIRICTRPAKPEAAETRIFSEPGIPVSKTSSQSSG
jgi:hypothetical protein